MKNAPAGLLEKEEDIPVTRMEINRRAPLDPSWIVVAS